MSKPPYITKKYFIFDAFGTLFKTTNFQAALEELVGIQAERLVQSWRNKQLSYTWLYNQMKQYLPFNEITKRALYFALNKHQLEDNGVSDLLLPIL